MKFQIVSLKPMEGIGKESKKPYKMIIVSGIFTNDDGTVELGEVVFMERPTAPLPSNLVAGHSYTPIINASARQGRLSFEIVELKPLAAKAMAAAA